MRPAIGQFENRIAGNFTYIIHLTGYTFGVVVRADAPWKTFAELIDYAKANPDKINYGTPGAGSSLHITMEQIAKQKQSYKDAMLKLDMEPYYLGTAEYHAYALQQITEQKQLVEELGLRQQ